jgi:hypothetical protein
MRVIEGGPNDQEIIRRIATAVIAQWNGFDQMTKDGLLREACLAVTAASKTTSLSAEILAFIRKHQEDSSAPGP